MLQTVEQIRQQLKLEWLSPTLQLASRDRESFLPTILAQQEMTGLALAQTIKPETSLLPEFQTCGDNQVFALAQRERIILGDKGVIVELHQQCIGLEFERQEGKPTGSECDTGQDAD